MIWVQIISTFLVCQAGKFAKSCKLETVAFVLPVSLTQTISALAIIACINNKSMELSPIITFLGGHKTGNPESFNFGANRPDESDFVVRWISLLFVFVWTACIGWTTFSLWPTASQHSTNRTLSTRGYCGLLVDQSLLQKCFLYPTIKRKTGGCDKNVKRAKIIACVTMWHETEEEMRGLLKSIFLMDKYLSDRLVITLCQTSSAKN